MRLIEDIRNRGYKGFDKLPHYDLSGLIPTLCHFSDPTFYAYARPIHDVMTCELKTGWGGVVAYVHRLEGVQLQEAVYARSLLGEEVENVYLQTQLVKAEGEWRALFPEFAMYYNSSWVVRGAQTFLPEAEVVKGPWASWAQRTFPFLDGWNDGSDAPKGHTTGLDTYNAIRTFFALCHTQGVETVTHTPTQKLVKHFRRKNRKIPRSFSTLKLSPALQSVVDSESEGEGNSLETPHFRRGHLNTSKHPRYRVKNWWTESHIVGKDLPGKLLTDTKVVE
jgi:hypothetical protein